MPESFGAELRRLRLAAGLKQSDLADRMGVRVSYVSDIEHNHRGAAQALVDALMGALPVGTDTQHLRELAFLARGECCPKCGFGGEE